VNLKVYGNRTILKPIENQDTKVGLIIIPNASQTKWNDTAIVVDSSYYTKGIKVLMNPYNQYNEIDIDKEKYFIVNTNDILGVIE